MTTIRIQRKPTPPPVLEAIQWTGGNWVNVLAFAGTGAVHWDDKESGTLNCNSLYVAQGDWLVKDEHGQCTPYTTFELDAAYNRVK